GVGVPPRILRETVAMAIEVVSGGQHPEAVAALLADLPEWFGIESANRAYVEAARSLPTVVARADDDIVGACLVKRHFPEASEIELLAVRRALHRRGVGRLLVGRVETDLRLDGASHDARTIR